MYYRRGMTRLTGGFRLDLPADQAFRLFTARGEQDWVAGWTPRFPVETADDTAPGTVFETEGHGQTTTWVVVDRVPGRRIAYARVVAGFTAGTVTVELQPAGGQSDVTVSYDLTPLSPAGADYLREFAAGYPEFLRSWATAIAAMP